MAASLAYIDPHRLGVLRARLDTFRDDALAAFQAEAERK
jgi:hypothetical protein